MTPLKLLVEAEFRHFDRCDASGAVALDHQHFVVADDEQNVLSIYRSDTNGAAIHTCDINNYFTPNDGKEVDLEGSTILDGLVFWITSHGANRQGENRPKRHQFFATKINSSTGQIAQVGHSYTQLLDDLKSDERCQKYDFKAAAKIAPKEPGGLNIEGLATTPQQDLLIGFRNPMVDHQALVIKLKNPQDLVLDPKARAQLGKPIELDLGGLGIRSLEYWPGLQQYLIVAGAYDGSDLFALYGWSGDRSSAPQRLVVDLPTDFRPEGIVLYPNQPDRVQLISDDGAVVRDGQTACKDLQNSEHKYFRSLWLRAVLDSTNH